MQGNQQSMHFAFLFDWVIVLAAVAHVLSPDYTRADKQSK